MKRRFSNWLVVILGICLTLTVTGCGKKQDTAGSVINGWKEYKSPEGWSFRYPSSWDRVEKDYIQQTGTGKTISFHSKSCTLKEVEEWLQFEKKRKLSATEAENTLVEEKKAVDDHGFIIYTYTINSKMDGLEALLKTVVIYDGKQRYEFHTQIPPVTEEEFKTLVDSMNI